MRRSHDIYILLTLFLLISTPVYACSCSDSVPKSDITFTGLLEQIQPLSGTGYKMMHFRVLDVWDAPTLPTRKIQVMTGSPNGGCGEELQVNEIYVVRPYFKGEFFESMICNPSTPYKELEQGELKYLKKLRKESFKKLTDKTSSRLLGGYLQTLLQRLYLSENEDFRRFGEQFFDKEKKVLSSRPKLLGTCYRDDDILQLIKLSMKCQDESSSPHCRTHQFLFLDAASHLRTFWAPEKGVDYAFEGDGETQCQLSILSTSNKNLKVQVVDLLPTIKKREIKIEGESLILPDWW